MLALVMQARETSDYNPEIGMSQANAEAIMEDARTFVAQVKAFLNIS